jgi:hypothetical protein
MANRIGVRLGTVSLPAMMVASPALLAGPAANFVADFQSLTALPSGFTLARTTNTMMIDSSGRRTYGPANLIQNSAASADNGAISGDKFIPDATTNGHTLHMGGARSASSAFFSVELKADGYDKLLMIWEDTGTFGRYKIDLTNGVAIDTSTGTPGAGFWSAVLGMVDKGSGWYEFSVLVHNTDPSKSFAQPSFVVLNPASSFAAVSYASWDQTFAGDGTSGFHWRKPRFASLTYETARRTQDAVDTTDSMYFGPCFHHRWDGSTWAQAGLQNYGVDRQNIIQNSDNLTESSWFATSNMTRTLSATAGADGFLQMTSLEITSASGSTNCRLTASASNSYTGGGPFFVATDFKWVNHDFVFLSLRSGLATNDLISVVFDIKNGLIGETFGGQTGNSFIGTPYIERLYNGVIRCGFVGNLVATTNQPVLTVGFAKQKSGNTFTNGIVVATWANTEKVLLSSVILSPGSSPVPHIVSTFNNSGNPVRGRDIFSYDPATPLSHSTGYSLAIEFENNQNLEGFWNPIDKDLSVSLSRRNLRAKYAGAGNGSIRGNYAGSQGCYYEVTIGTALWPATAGAIMVGLANATHDLTNHLGNSNAIGWSNNGQYYGASGNAGTGIGGYIEGDRVGVLLLATSVKFYKNDVFQFELITLPPGQLYPAVSFGNATEYVTGNFSGPFSVLPSGARAWVSNPTIYRELFNGVQTNTNTITELWVPSSDHFEDYYGSLWSYEKPQNFREVALNPADKGSNVVLTNENLTVTKSADSYQLVKATLGRDDAVGDFFFTAHIDVAFGQQEVGLTTGEAALNATIYGTDSNGVGWVNFGIFSNNVQLSTDTFTTGDLIGVRWQPAIQTATFYKWVSGAWSLVRSVVVNFTGKTVFPAIFGYSAGGQTTANFGAQVMTLPAGSQSWKGAKIIVPSGVQPVRWIASYASNDFLVSVNGTTPLPKVGGTNSAAPASITKFWLGNYHNGGYGYEGVLRNLAIFNSQLRSKQLQKRATIGATYA